jgi:hypothetical protein
LVGAWGGCHAAAETPGFPAGIPALQAFLLLQALLTAINCSAVEVQIITNDLEPNNANCTSAACSNPN